MDDHSKKYKYSAKSRANLQDEMRKKLQYKRKLDRANAQSGDNRPSFDEWLFMSESFGKSVYIAHSAEDIVNNIQAHPYLMENATYPAEYIQNASVKLLPYLRSGILLLQQQRVVYKPIECKFFAYSLSADLLPLVLPPPESTEVHIYDGSMDTSEFGSIADFPNENEVKNAVDIFITRGTVQCTWLILQKTLQKNRLNDIDLGLLELIIEFIAFVSSLRPSYFNPVSLKNSHIIALETIKSPLFPDSNHITNVLYFMYNIFQSSGFDFQSFIFAQLLPLISDQFHCLCTTLENIHSHEEPTVKFMMIVAALLQFAFDFQKKMEREELLRFYQFYESLIADCVFLMSIDTGFTSTYLSSIVADVSDLYIQVITKNEVYIYLDKALGEPALLDNSYRMVMNLVKELEPPQLIQFLQVCKYYEHFASAISNNREDARNYSFSVMDIILRKLPIDDIAPRTIESGLFFQLCDQVFWGSSEDGKLFLRFIPLILTWEGCCNYLNEILSTEMIPAFCNVLENLKDEEVSNVIRCIFRIHQWCMKAEKEDLFQSKVGRNLVHYALNHPDISERKNPELEEQRIKLLTILHESPSS